MYENKNIKEPPIEHLKRPKKPKNAYKFGPYLIVPHQVGRFDWFGYVYLHETEEYLWGCYDRLQSIIFERCSEWIINNHEKN